MNTTKRLYFYGVSFVTLVVAANGVALLVQFLVDLIAQRTIAGGPDTQASLGLAMVVVGAPLWVLHWLYTQRQAAKQPDETASTLRKLYLYGVLFTASLVVFIAVHSLIFQVMGGDDFSAYFAGQALVWGIVWAYHWSVERREQAVLSGLTLKRWYMYGTSVYTLIALFGGATGVLVELFQWAYDSLFQARAIISDGGVWNSAMQDGIASLLAGGVWWSFHWFYLARRDFESTLRQVYLNLFAFLGGAITALAAIGTVLYAVIRWLLGGTELLTTPDHFRVITTAVPFLFAGMALLLYHWQVLQDESRLLAGRLAGAKRSFGYIMSAIGLGAAAVGIPLIVGAVIGQVLPESSIAGAEPVRDQLAFALTVLIIGVPLWYWYWPRMQRTVREGGAEERGALARRIYIYGVLGVLALAGIGSLIGFLTGLFNDLLRGDLTVDFLRNGRWMLGIIAGSGALLPYHWQVLREDQREGGEPTTTLKSVTLLASGESASELAKQLKEALGVRIRLMHAVSESGTPALSDEQMDALLESIGSVSAERLLVVVAEGQVKVHGYR